MWIVIAAALILIIAFLQIQFFWWFEKKIRGDTIVGMNVSIANYILHIAIISVVTDKY